MFKSTLVIPPLAVLTLAGLAAADAPPSHIVEMEIVDTPKQGSTHTVHFAMAVVEDRGWFANTTSDASANVHVSARLDRERGAANVVLNVEVQRHGSGDLDIHGAKIVDAKRSLMGRVERNDGVSEIFATVR